MDKWFEQKMFIRGFAVLVGLLLWVIIRIDAQGSLQPLQGEVYSQKYVDVTVAVKNLNEDRFSLLSLQPNKINLTVTGSQTALGRLLLQKYEVFVDVSQGVPGKQRMRLQMEGFPDEVDVKFDPSSVVVYLDEKQQKEMPIQLQITGNPRAGFTAGEPLVEPSRAIVTVTETSASDIAKVVGMIKLNDEAETVTTSVPLVALDRNGKVIDVPINPAIVNVKIPITSPFQTIPLRVSLKGTTPPGIAVARLEQLPEEVTVYGKKEIVDQMTYYEGPTVDLSGLTSTVEKKLLIPVVSTVARVNPQEVNVKVVVEEAETIKVPNVVVGMIGQSTQYQYNWQPNETGKRELAVEIATSRKNLVSVKGIQAVIDVTNLPPGTYTLPIDVQLPLFVELVSQEALTATVRVTAK